MTQAGVVQDLGMDLYLPRIDGEIAFRVEVRRTWSAVPVCPT
jgi:hypothetical protein